MIDQLSQELLPVLNNNICQYYYERLFKLRTYWKTRHTSLPFYTLGLAAYLDAYHFLPAISRHNIIISKDYLDNQKLADNNQWLDFQFEELYQRVCEILSIYLQAPVKLSNAAARPGFHIYLAHPAFGLSVAQIHQDRQYLQAFPKVKINEHDLWSFTLALKVPKNSGLNVWLSSNKQPKFIPYNNGFLVIHSGHLMHQAVINSVDMPRLTLQGHAIKLNDQYEIYW